MTKAMQRISEARGRAIALRSEADRWPKTASEDDAQATLRTAAIWLEPARLALVEAAELPDRVQIGDREKVRTLAGLLLGHLFELRDEARNANSKGIVRELDEYVETADEFLAMPELKKFMLD